MNLLLNKKIIEVVDRKREQEMDTTFDSVQYNKEEQESHTRQMYTSILK